MPPAADHITVVRGDTFERVYQIEGLADVAAGLVPLTAAKVSAVVEVNYGAAVADRVAFAVSVVEADDAGSYVVTLALTDEQTATLTASRYVWSLRVTDLPGDTDDVSYTLSYGNVTVLSSTHAQAV